MISPSVLAVAVPSVTIQRSAVVSCVTGGSPGNTIRTFALMFVGPLESRELMRLLASLSFQRAWRSALVQKAVLPTGKSGTGGAALLPWAGGWAGVPPF